MATLEIEGRDVEVDDAFLTMTPEQQNAAVEEIAASMKLAPAAPAEAAPAPAQAAPPTAEKPPETFRDFQRQAIREDRGGLDAFQQGATQGMSFGLADELFGIAATPIELGIGVATGEDEGKGVLERIADSYARARDTSRGSLDTARENHGGAVLAGELGGGLATGAATIAGTIPKAAPLLAKVGVGAGEGVVQGAVSGWGAGEGAEDSLDQARFGAALGLGLGATVPAVAPAVSRTASAAKNAVAPFTRSGQERLAAEKLGGGASDVLGLRAALATPTPDLVAGSKPTTFQLTGDMGVGSLERAAATRSPAPFQDRRAEQNAARLGVLGGIQPTGAAEKVADAARRGFDDLDVSTQGLLDSATSTARRATDDVGAGMTPDVAGDTMRGGLESSRAAVKTDERKLWKEVDPDGTLSLGLGGLRSRAAELKADLPGTAKPMEGEEAAIFDVVKGLPEQVPFANVQGLKSRLRDAAQAERTTNGETAVNRRLGLLQSSLYDDLDNAASGAPFADGSVPTFDRAARDRLSSANQTTKSRVETFDNATLGPMRARPSPTSPYDMPASAVPGRIFYGEPTSFDAVGTFRKAVGDQAARDALQGYAVDRLRKEALAADGTLDPAKLASWRTKHADALRAFPDLDRKLADAGKAGEAMAEVAASRAKALKDYQTGAVGRLMGVDDPEDVTKIVGGVFGAQDGVARMGKLAQVVAGDADAQQGLRRAVVDHVKRKFVGNTEAATTGLGTIKSDGFQTFVKDNRAVLKAAGMTDTEIDTLGAIADDIQRSNRSLTAVRIPGQSNTAQDSGSVLSRILRNPATVPGSIGVGLSAATGGVGGLVLGAAGGLAAKVVGNMRAAGLTKVEDILEDALLNPDRARLLLQRLDPAANPKDWEKIAQAFARSATTTTNIESGSRPASRAPFQN